MQALKCHKQYLAIAGRRVGSRTGQVEHPYLPCGIHWFQRCDWELRNFPVFITGPVLSLSWFIYFIQMFMLKHYKLFGKIKVAKRFSVRFSSVVM